MSSLMEDPSLLGAAKATEGALSSVSSLSTSLIKGLSSSMPTGIEESLTRGQISQLKAIRLALILKYLRIDFEISGMSSMQKDLVNKKLQSKYGIAR
jgi:hypothetical protein